MAHLVENMAYVGDTPWHGLGQQLPEKQPIEIWAQAAGMDWEIKESPVHFSLDEGCVNGNRSTMFGTFPEQKVLYRSDNEQALSVVSNRYQVVQPREVLEFYRDLTEKAGYELETAGVLKQGRKFWALAKTGKETNIKGNDLVKGYLLLATSCDGTLATMATPTTVRVVCNNTLSIAINGAEQAVKVSHRTNFDADAVKQKLGVAVSKWDEFIYQMKLLSDCKIKNLEAKHFFEDVLDFNTETTASKRYQDKVMKSVHELYQGHGRGAELSASKGTAWGLLCSITEYVDHERRAHNTENRLDSAWFGQGNVIKQKALDRALQFIQ